MKPTILLGAVLLISISAISQDVIDVMDNTVFFEKSENHGNVGDEKLIIRTSGKERTPIAKVKIEKCVQDIVVADITALKPGYSIAVGDQIFDRPQNLQSIPSNSYKINQDSPTSTIPATSFASLTGTGGFRRFSFGLSGGLISPYATSYTGLKFSYQIGGLIRYGLSEYASLVLGIRYSMKHGPNTLNQHQKGTKSEDRFAGLSTDLLLRHSLIPGIALDLGASIYVPRLTVTASPNERKISEAEYHYGVCGGLVVNLIQAPSFSVNAVPRYTVYHLNGLLTENVTGGLELVF